MELVADKIYKYEAIAELLAQDCIADSLHMVGVTGTSSIGKSTFTRRLKEKLERQGNTVQIIQMDDYLNEKHRAKTQFWNRKENSYLKPEFFDWDECARDLNTLKQGIGVEKECYVRGIGWGGQKKLEPAQYLILEGLFLDSIQAAEYMEYDFLVAMKASDRLITKLRMQRDAHYRKKFKNFKRTEEETKQEIADTLLAARSYKICRNKWKSLKLFVLGGYRATLFQERRSKRE